MHSSLVIVCSAMVLLHGVSCYLFPQAVLNQVGFPKVYKRQTDSDEMAQQQCVLDKFDAVFQGNDSSFVRECRAVETAGNELDFSDPSQKYNISSILRTFCIPDCGNVIIDANDACGELESPEQKEYLIALCGANKNGSFCYDIFTSGLLLIQTEISCFIDSKSCNCLRISEGVAEQGCCINAHQDFFNSLDKVNYNPGEVYGACNIDLPAGCNNSPLQTSSSPPQASWISAVAILSALLVNHLLGYDIYPTTCSNAYPAL